MTDPPQPRAVLMTVDDDPSVSRAVARDLRRRYGEEFRIVRADSGSEAIDALKEILRRGERVAAILADYRMPHMNGIEFLQALRAEFGAAGPLVVFCTTENDVASIAAAIEHGAQEYIMKPFDKDIVTAKFQEVGLI